MQWSSPLVDPEFLWSPSSLVLPSVKVPRCSGRENFTLSILVALISIMLMFLVLFSSLLCSPAAPRTVTGAHQASLPGSVIAFNMALSLHLHPEPFHCNSLPLWHWKLGVTWVLCLWEPHSLLFMEGLIRHSEQKLNSSWVCWIDYIICKGTRCSCTGLQADSELYTVCAASSTISRHVHASTFFLEVSSSLL